MFALIITCCAFVNHLIFFTSMGNLKGGGGVWSWGKDAGHVRFPGAIVGENFEISS